MSPRLRNILLKKALEHHPKISLRFTSIGSPTKFFLAHTWNKKSPLHDFPGRISLDGKLVLVPNVKAIKDLIKRTVPGVKFVRVK